MAIPDYQSLMLPVLKLAVQGPTRVPKAAEVIAGELGLTEAEREEMLPSGRQRVLHNRIHWAKFYMGKAGLLDSPARGVFTASSEGKLLLASNPPSINLNVLKTYSSFVDFYIGANASAGVAVTGTTSAPPPAESASATPEEQIDSAYAVLQAALKADLLERVLGQSPTFFEGIIVDLLVAMGYGGSHENASLRLGKTGDGGVDGVIDEDRLGLDRIYVQAKRYAATTIVGRPEVQGFVGSLVGRSASKGVFVTTSSFSTLALDYVRHLPQRVILIDGGRLAELMVEHGVGVRTSRSVALKRVDEDFFAPE